MWKELSEINRNKNSNGIIIIKKNTNRADCVYKCFIAHFSKKKKKHEMKKNCLETLNRENCIEGQAAPLVSAMRTLCIHTECKVFYVFLLI